MIVLDASAALAALYRDGPARRALLEVPLHAPHLIDLEIIHSLRRRVRGGQMSARRGRELVSQWRRLAVTRWGVHSQLDRIWQLRDNLSAYDASYVVLAEDLGYPLLTADARLSRATGIHCSVEVVATAQ